ncbi:MAG: DUF2992 family protein [Ruthenibacterium lactatiformans]
MHALSVTFPRVVRSLQGFSKGGRDGCRSLALFTVFFEDPFWVGVYEREEPGPYGLPCGVGAEPKDGEI